MSIACVVGLLAALCAFPALAMAGPEPPETTLESTPADPIASKTAIFTFSGEDADDLAGELVFECKLDAGGFEACESGDSFEAVTGTHKFEVRAKDPEGNVDATPETFEWEVDATDPDTFIDSTPPDPDNSSLATFTFHGTDNHESGISFECSLDGALYEECESGDEFLVGTGSHEFDVKAIDWLENEDTTPAHYAWEVDVTAPDTFIDSTPPNPSNDGEPEFTFHGTDNHESGISFECSLDGAPYASCSSGDKFSVETGPHTFDVKAIDWVENEDPEPAHYAWEVDLIAPNTIIDSTPPPFTQSHEAEFEFHATDNHVGGYTFECSIDGKPYEPCTSPITYTELGEGLRTFDVKATDWAGNEDESAAHYEWIIDNTDPEIEITFPLNKEHFVLHQGGSPAYECSDPLAGSPLAASGIESCTDEGFSTDTLGSFLFTVKAEDKAGNTESKTIAYVVDPPRYADYLLNDEPLAYYRLNEPLGNDPMLDRSGNGHDGTYKNGVVLRRGPAPTCHRRPHPPHACTLKGDPQDYSAYFPPRDGYGYANNITAPTTAYSLEAWVKPADGADMMIAAHGGGGQIFISGGHFAFRQTQDTIVASGAGGEVPPGVWTHVAASWDGSTSRLYVNGILIASSTSANKAPSGTATFYVGYGDQAPWFHGHLDEVAYYGKAVSGAIFNDHWEIGTAFDHPSPEGFGASLTGPENTNTAIPYANIEIPVNKATYAPTKVPTLIDFNCTDLDEPPFGDIETEGCTAKLDGSPVASGDPMPQTAGTYSLEVTAVDKGGNVYTHTHTFEVVPYVDVIDFDEPVAYYRLDDGEGAEAMADYTGAHHGIYKNDQDSGPVGISGDGNRARSFFGAGGYGYVNGIPAPRYESSMEAWVYPDDTRNQAIMGHGDGGELDIISGHFTYRHMDKTVTASIGGECVGPTAEEWTHVVGTWDGIDQKIYVNGVLCGSIESTKQPTSISTFYVGFGELAPWFAGSLDEVAYFSRALSAERVYEHYIADPPADVSASGGESGGSGDSGGSGGGSTGSGAPSAPPAAAAPSAAASAPAAPAAAAPVAGSQTKAAWGSGKKGKGKKRRWGTKAKWRKNCKKRKAKKCKRRGSGHYRSRARHKRHRR